MLIPARRRGVEILDDPNVDPAVREQAQVDVARSNRWLGGLRAAAIETDAVLAGVSGDVTLLDVGTGVGDIPAAVAVNARPGVRLTTIGVDRAPSLLAAPRDEVTHVVCADALALPFRDRAIDIVICSMLLHHFDDAGAQDVLREMNRVASRAVVVSDLRRSWIAAFGFWLVSFPLRFHRITRHDGLQSVLRGFTRAELARLVVGATGAAPEIRQRLGYRITARWSPRT
jgi:ubiquinone/menaquinone biosynthesis C-methylase UbiE